MKNFLILLITCFLYSCGSYVQPEKQTYTKVAQYEGGNKSDGVVYMSVVFEPQTENPPTINVPESEAKASQICRNWGYSNNAKLEGGDTQGKCIQYNYNTGNCTLIKIPLKIICQ